MGEPINSEGYDNCPIVTPDGLYLIYHTPSGEVGGPHWIAIEDRLKGLRSQAIAQARPCSPRDERHE
ncbi:MAG: hypothetical protein GF400_10525 [Candidatus Eisenbacteria bacterium]|nr:hypothetical protein [Candidatus Eisenbacteria bacterium]